VPAEALQKVLFGERLRWTGFLPSFVGLEAVGNKLVALVDVVNFVNIGVISLSIDVLFQHCLHVCNAIILAWFIHI
jgi:hypothetical protein